MIKTIGYAAPVAKSPLAPYNFERRDVGPHDVLIDIKYCGICHSDIHQARDEWGGALFPMVPGHEIVGIVNQVGSQVSMFKKDDRVGVGCMVDSCRQCTNCHEGLQQYCLEGLIPTYNGRERKGGSLTQGGYSTKIVVDENFVLRLPPNLDLAAMAPLLCAGITLYSPLKYWRAETGKNVGIIGLGGLGHVGVKIAAALGAKVSVFSHSNKKAEDAKYFGAQNFYATADSAIFTKLANTFDLIICTVSVGVNWNDYLKLLKTDSTMVIIGIPEQEVPVGGAALIFGRRSLSGSLIGGINETQEMLNFCSTHHITADIELISMQDVNKAYERVLQSDVRYRFVIDLASLAN